MTVSKRLLKLRELMKVNGVDMYVVPTADFHNSEYVGDYFKSREYISGFSGSYGTVIITKDFAGVWTDGRYFLQAEKELSNSEFELQKMGEQGVLTVSEYIETNIPTDGVLGFDGRVITFGEGKNLFERLQTKGAKINYNLDLVGDIWENRPTLSKNKAFSLALSQAGETVFDKLSRVRLEMKKVGANVHIITTLDDIGWLLNIRGTDVKFCPLLLSYAVVYMDKVDLYVDETKLSNSIKEDLLSNNVFLKPYNDIYEDVKCFSSSDVLLLDPERLNYAMFNNISSEVKIIEMRNPTVLMKALKNDVEIENTIKAHIKDGVANTKFLYWLKKLVKEGTISNETELSATKKLEDFRKEQGDYIFASFDPICGHGANGAIVHYSSSEETNVALTTGTFLLTDTGANYKEGTTDITRTTALGEISLELKQDYTRVLKGNLNLSKAKFKEGVSGVNLDIFARMALWENYQDFNHGTGHGVGYLSNVHEGPAGIFSQASRGVEPLKAGMILTNEPGLYISGSHGIRLENEMVVRKTTKNDYGQFLEFEVITYAPFDLEAIDESLLTNEDKKELNNYHKKVYEVISPYLTEDERNWLKIATREI